MEKMEKSEKLTAVFATIFCVVVAMTLLMTIHVQVNLEGRARQAAQTTVPTTAPTTAPPTTQPPTTAPSTEGSTAAPSTEQTEPAEDDHNCKLIPDCIEDIIDKYTLLVDDFKEEKPAYKKKEYQALPEEYRNFGTGVNAILSIAANYMVTEDECEELVRSAGAEEILIDMPIHNSEKGCALTDYDAVEWAKAEDQGDGTCKLSFSLKEEKNAEPTPADTLIPPSAHGAVMQPMPFADVKNEVQKISDSVPGIAVNGFNLTYRDCVFSCVYDIETDRVLSITHHIVIDIDGDADLLGANINGTARLLNEMFIYDITW